MLRWRPPSPFRDCNTVRPIGPGHAVSFPGEEGMARHVARVLSVASQEQFGEAFATLA
jgi:hypothetical protein